MKSICFLFLLLCIFTESTLSWSLFPSSYRVRRAKSLLRRLKTGKSRIHPDIAVVSVGGGDECGIQFRHRERRRIHTTASKTGTRNNGEVIFVDRDEFLTPQSGLETPVGQALQAYLSRPENVIQAHPEKLPQIYLAVYLTMYKRRLLPSIPATTEADYLDTLPSDFGLQHLPIFWEDKMLEELQCSAVKQGVTERRREWIQEFLMVRSATKDASLPIGFQAIELEEWFWARSIVTSRAFTDPSSNGDPCLCPYVDMMNHVTATQSQSSASLMRCTWEIDSDGYHLRLPTTKKDDNLGVWTKLEISYGSHSNGHFLMNYGFSIPDDIDQVAADLATLQITLPENVHTDDTEAIWEADGLGDCHMVSRNVTVGIGGCTGPMESVLSLCRVASTQNQELPKMKKRFMERGMRTIQTEDGLVPQMGATLSPFPLSISNEKRALQMLKVVTQSALNNYETTIEEDNGILQGGEEETPGTSKYDFEHDTTQRSNAITVRRGEKIILQHYSSLASIGLNFLESSTTIDFEIYKRMLEASLEDPQPFVVEEET